MKMGMGLGLGYRGTAATGPVTPTTEATHGNVTFTVEGTYTTGNYVDGPAYIVIPTGTASMTSITPAQTTEGGYVINGAEKNPVRAVSQGFDERVSQAAMWDAGKTLSLPATVTGADVVLKVVSHEGDITAGSASSTRNGLIDEWGACYIVTSAPAANSFSPAAAGWVARGTPAASVIDVSAKVAAIQAFLPGGAGYDTTAHDKPTYDQIALAIGGFDPALARMAQYGTYEYSEFFRRKITSEEARYNYGQYIAGQIGAACLALLSDDFTTGQKENIYTWLVSYGKQWFDTIDATDDMPAPNGGHYQFHLAPMVLYLDAIGGDYSSLVTDHGGNFLQAIKLTAGQVAQFTNHTDSTKPYPWRSRNLDAVSGLDLTLEVETVANGDPGQVTFLGCDPIRVSDSATASVVSEAYPGGLTVVTIDAQPGSPFLLNDTVYFEPDYVPAEGAYDWGLEGAAGFYSFNPVPDAPYRNLNQWSSQVLLLGALGLTNADMDAVVGYVKYANEANKPAAGYDYANHHDFFLGTTADGDNAWAADFWADHAATIFPPAVTNLLTNGDFASATGWVANGTWSISGGEADCPAGNAFVSLNQNAIAITSGGIEHEAYFTFTAIANDTGNYVLRITEGNGTNIGTTHQINVAIPSTPGASSVVTFTPHATCSEVEFYLFPLDAAGAFTVDDAYLGET